MKSVNFLIVGFSTYYFHPVTTFPLHFNLKSLRGSDLKQRVLLNQWYSSNMGNVGTHIELNGSTWLKNYISLFGYVCKDLITPKHRKMYHKWTSNIVPHSFNTLPILHQSIWNTASKYVSHVDNMLWLLKIKSNTITLTVHTSF